MSFTTKNWGPKTGPEPIGVQDRTCACGEQFTTFLGMVQCADCVNAETMRRTEDRRAELAEQRRRERLGIDDAYTLQDMRRDEARGGHI